MRGLCPDRNPLRRATDRLETVVLAILLAMFCVGAPLIASAAGNWVNTTSQRELRVQQSAYHRVSATLLSNAQNTGAYLISVTPEADARWTAPDGRTVTGTIDVTASAKAGAVVVMWTDSSGHQVTPLTPAAVSTQEHIAAGEAIAALGGIVVLTGLTIRAVLNRGRMTAWDADWAATEPRWTARR